MIQSACIANVILFRTTMCFYVPKKKNERKCITLLNFCLVFITEHGQKFPGLRPANAAGLDGSQQKWAETGPGGACPEASADRIQPGAPQERQTAVRVPLSQNIWLACSTASRGHLLHPQHLPHCHLSGRGLPQRHFQTNLNTCTRGQTGATALLPDSGDIIATDRAEWVNSILLWSHFEQFKMSHGCMCWDWSPLFSAYSQLLTTMRNCRTVNAYLN